MTTESTFTDADSAAESPLYGRDASLLEVLLRGRGAPVSVRPQDALRDAIELMFQNDYSQLPVVDAAHRPIGLLTQKDVLRTVDHIGSLSEDLIVRDAMRDVQPQSQAVARSNVTVWSVLDRFERIPALLVVDGEGRLVGIVTDHDTTRWLRQRSEDILAVQDIEETLRQLIRDAYDRDGSADLDATVQRMQREMWSDGPGRLIRKAIGRYVGGGVDGARCRALIDELAVEASAAGKGFDHLSFAQYRRLLFTGTAWIRYAPHVKLRKAELDAVLDRTNQTRNDLAHLRGGLDRRTRDHLQWFKQWLEQTLVPLLAEPTAGDESLPPGEVGAEDDAPPGAGHDAGSPASAADEALAEADELPEPVEEPSGESASLEGLTDWLRRRRRRKGERVTLTFDEIDALLAEPLPAEARQHRSWWSNASPHADAWLAAGYSVAGFFVNDQKVRFSKDRARERKYLEFFQEVAQRVQDLHGWSFEPKAYNWLPFERVEAKCGKRFPLLVAFTRDRRFRLHAEIDVGDGARNAEILAGLQAHRDAIEARLGAPLDWRPAEGKRVCQVSLYAPGEHHIEGSAAALQQLAQWAAEQMGPFTQIMREFVAGA